MHFTITEKQARTTQAANKARTEQRRAERLAPYTFHAIDGEGETDEKGNHHYVLLGIGTDQISRKEGLEWDEIFSFLWRHFEPGRHVYTGYYLGYDFTQWLSSLPQDRAEALFTVAGKAKRVRKHKSKFGETHFPVYAGKWEFDLLGSKRFKLRPRGSEEWMYICDGGPFFQASFLSTINPEKWDDEPVCTPEEYAEIVEGKGNRASAKLGSEMKRYNALENTIHERLMTRLHEGLVSIGIGLKPGQWFGPGQIAQAWLSDRRAVPTAKQLAEIVPDWFLDAARKTYYGGWFELFAHGHIPGETHEYDINSAYPYIISKLPCLRHGTYSYGHGNIRGKLAGRYGASTDSNVLCIVRGTVYGTQASGNDDGNYSYPSRHDGSPAGSPIGTMLHRTRKGNILRPNESSGYFWLHELEAAEKAGCITRIKYDEWYLYEPCDCPPPLAEVQELYAERKRVGKNTALGKAIKLLINSIYGKFAQSIGNPKYGNPIYASLITAGCRTIILEGIATHPKGAENVVMVATDGIYFLDPHPTLPISGNLGDWEHDILHNLCLFKPGMYWSDKDRRRIAEGKAPAFKARGINAADFASKIAEVDRMFAKWPKKVKGDLTSRDSFKWPEIEFMGKFAMTTCLQAIQRGKWNTAGYVTQEVTLKQSSSHHKKRAGLFYDTERGIYRSRPWLSGIWFPEDSVPYEKRFGLEDPWSIESLEEFGITPDGTVADLFTEIVMRHDD